MEYDTVNTDLDLDSCLYNIFRAEYVDYRNEHWCINSMKGTWADFINTKNLGIICSLCKDRGVLQYKIVDENQYILSKLKYGF